MSKEFDLVLLGPTGYTGQYTAEAIYQNFPTTLKWAVAGRSHSKIESLVQKWKQLGYDRPDPGMLLLPCCLLFNCVLTSAEILIVQMNLEDLNALAKRTRLIINCVGPYHLYSTPVIEACAENGTHYVDVFVFLRGFERPYLTNVQHGRDAVGAESIV